jgi:uncharacterized membrane protein
MSKYENLQMKSIFVLGLVVVFMFLGFFMYRWLQNVIQPKRSFSRLIFYFVAVLVSVFILSFIMVFVISKIYPDELMK